MYSVIDAVKLYHQIQIDDSSKTKTGFIIDRGTYQFLKLPMGVTSGPGFFNSILMDKFSERLYKDMAIFLDDCIIFTSDDRDCTIFSQ